MLRLLLLLELELWEPVGLPLNRHRDAGTAFILGGSLVPDTLSALPPTFIPPFPYSTHTHTLSAAHMQSARFYMASGAIVGLIQIFKGQFTQIILKNILILFLVSIQTDNRVIFWVMNYLSLSFPPPIK